MNPLGFNYGTDTTAVPGFAKPSAIIVTGRGNRYDPAFQTARKNGGLVYAYWNPLSVPVGSKNPQDLEQWMGDTAKVPRWRFQGGPIRSQWEGTEMVDIRPGSAWRVFFRKISEELIRRDLFDGFFVDTLGARPWAGGWESWPVAEQVAWAECCVDLAREMHELRAAIAPKFEIVHNNIWDLPKDHPADALVQTGDKYCNGVCLENSPPDAKVLKDTGRVTRSLYHINYAARSFAGGAFVRRLLLITNRPELRDEWKADPNVTHITHLDKAKAQDYMRIIPPIVPYHDESPPPSFEEQLAAARAKIEQLQDQLTDQQKLSAALEAQNDALQTKNADLQTRVTQIGAYAAEIEKLVAP